MSNFMTADEVRTAYAEAHDSVKSAVSILFKYSTKPFLVLGVGDHIIPGMAVGDAVLSCPPEFVHRIVDLVLGSVCSVGPQFRNEAFDSVARFLVEASDNDLDSIVKVLKAHLEKGNNESDVH